MTGFTALCMLIGFLAIIAVLTIYGIICTLADCFKLARRICKERK